MESPWPPSVAIVSRGLYRARPVGVVSYLQDFVVECGAESACAVDRVVPGPRLGRRGRGAVGLPSPERKGQNITRRK